MYTRKVSIFHFKYFGRTGTFLLRGGGNEFKNKHHHKQTRIFFGAFEKSIERLISRHDHSKTYTTTGEEMCLQHWVIVPKYFRLYVALRSSTIVNQAQRV